MRIKKSVPHLKVLPQINIKLGPMKDPPVQNTLFPVSPQSFIGLVNMSRMSAESFIETLEIIHPKWIFDLRPLPRFDLGFVDRRRAFDLFQKLKIAYRDISGIIGVNSYNDARLNPGIVSSQLLEIMRSHNKSGLFGPLIILLDNDEHIIASARLLPKLLKPSPKGGWTVRVYA